jgi:hypothetical protein
MKKAIPSRLLELKQTQGEYRKFFSNLGSDGKNPNFVEMMEEANKIKNPLIRFGCMVDIFVETANQFKDNVTQDWKNELLSHSEFSLDLYVTGQIGLSVISSLCDLMYQTIQEKNLVQSN